MPSSPDLLTRLLDRLRQVRHELGYEPLAVADGEVEFAEALDSMGLVEYVGVVADDCGVSPEQVERAAGGHFRTVAELAAALTAPDLAGVAVHGGNGRLPSLLARRLGLPAEKVWSETARTGNLGSASLPVAWAAQAPAGPGPVVWVAFGAGAPWGAALFGACPARDGP
jgi:hypothetical protein